MAQLSLTLNVVLVGCLLFSAYLHIQTGLSPNSVEEVSQSIDCMYTPPDVSLPEMHLEIRQLLLDEFAGLQGAILLNGGFVTTRYNTDVEQVFRQESNFLYVTGYSQPNATVVLDIPSKRTILFIEDHPESYAIWNGVVESPQQISQEYLIPEVYFRASLPNILSQLQSAAPSGKFVVYVMDDLVEFPDKSKYSVNTVLLPQKIYDRREKKTDSELALMRYAASVSSGAHELVMNYTKPGLFEYNIEGKFLDGCFACGLTIQAYIPICASGNNSAILHYVANDREMKNGDLLLIDAGAEYNGYGTDITRTYPVNGEYTDQQKEVYNMVLDVQFRVINRVRPGLTWTQLQGYAEEYTCDVLTKFGYLDATSQECLDNSLYGYFFPHGVSHYIGIDVHDRSFLPVSLEERNVITVEPGIYFNQALLEPVLSPASSISHYFVKDKIQPLLDNQFGGVRIEDVVIVWNTGAEVISFPPKTVFGVENQMSK